MNHQHLSQMNLYLRFDVLYGYVAIGERKQKIKVTTLFEAKSYHLLLLVVGIIFGVGEQKGLPNLSHCFPIFSLEKLKHEFGFGILHDLLSCKAFLIFCRKSKSKMRYTAGKNDLGHDLWGYFCKSHGNSSSKAPSNCYTTLNILQVTELFQILRPISKLVAMIVVARVSKSSEVDSDNMVRIGCQSCHDIKPPIARTEIAVDKEKGGSLMFVLNALLSIEECLSVGEGDV